ncbi:unnamed protein product, partial [Mesorhabditis belari]|uniref:Calcineurin-like phosphoesterase domain-containing protein n=1 Tax=Mesorhabditis belari TaxID=2138241 RepID=A0AAF3EZK3_9BILA
MLSPAMLKSMGRRTSREVNLPLDGPRSRDSKGNLLPLLEEEEVIHYNGRRRASNHSILDFDGDTAVMLRGVFEQEALPSRSGNRRASVIAMNAKQDRERRGSLTANVKIQPHQYTEDPTVAWEMLKAKRPVKRVIQMKPETPIRVDHVRFVCIGCTHGQPLPALPDGDVLIVTGDFTSCGLPKEVKNFNAQLASTRHAYRILIAGNHECTFDESFLKSQKRDIGEAKEEALKQALLSALHSAKMQTPKQLITNGIYLQDDLIELFGITIYGTPWQPRVDNWAFNLPRGQALLDKWNQIPTGVDVLITHTPPLGHGDLMANGQRMGCVELLNTVAKRVKPKYHVYGHIHEGYGCSSDGYTKFINCCATDANLDLVNNPVIFDIPVHPTTKQYYLNNIKKITKRVAKELEKK